MGFESELKAYAERVESKLRELLPPVEDDATLLHAAMRYATLGSGKRLRPGLAMACAEAVGGSSDDALIAGCAIELVHCFSLIHDDLPAIDNDDLRRGQPTVHRKFDEATAILAGDALFALSFELMARCHPDPGRSLQCVQTLAWASGVTGLVGGEMLDIWAEGKQVDADTLVVIHQRKTSALFQAACEVGAITGGGTPAQIQALGCFGSWLGLAFQIADDVLNETGAPDQLGKAAGSDRLREKTTYPALFGLEGAMNEGRKVAEKAEEHLKGFENAHFLAETLQFSLFRDR